VNGRVRRPRAELAIVLWSAIAFGALLASYSAFRPVREALVLDGDPDHIPWLFTATFIAVSILSPAWGALVAKGPRRVVPLAFHAFALCIVAFSIVVGNHVAPVTVGRVFYVWSAVFSLFVVSVFWSLLADLLGPGTARRLYGPIAAGGTIGTVVGPALTKAFVGSIGVAGVLALSAILLELSVAAVYQVRRSGRALAPEGDADPPVTGGALDGITHVARSPYLSAVAGYVLCTACAATFVYLAQADIAKHAIPDRVARTDFFATIDLWVALVTFVLQVVIAAPLLRWLGPGILLCVLPIVQAAGITTLVVAPSLTALVVFQVAARSATHGLTRPSRELLFTVLSRADKYRAKNVIDTAVYRFGDFSSSWLDLGLKRVHPGGGAVAIAAIALSTAWLVLATCAGIGFARRNKTEA
jgi:AAA family ATP:ADP antiporter